MYKFWIFLGIILATVYIAFIYHSSAIMLFAYAEAAFFVVSFIYLLIRRFSIKARLEVPVGVSESGKENLVKIVIRNQMRLPLMRMKALLVVEETLSGRKEKSWMNLPQAAPGTNYFSGKLTLKGAGNYEVTLKKIKIYDMTGLLSWNIRGKSSGKIQILPELHEVPVFLTSATKHFYGESDMYDEHRSGYDNSEIFGIRAYQKGDRIQHVHWKLSAKQDELMVKEQSLPKSCPVVLFLDYHKKSKKKSTVGISYLEAAASISFSMTDAGCSHYVVWYDEEQRDIIRIRVDDEESLYYLISSIMEAKWVEAREDLLLRYQEKYRMEPYVWALFLDQELVLKKNDEVLAKIAHKDLKESLSQVELLL